MVDMDGSGPLSDGLDRDRMDIYTLIERKDKNGHPGELSIFDGSEAKSPKHVDHVRHLSNIRRLALNVKSRLHQNLPESPRLHNDQRRADQTNLAPLLAPAPSAEAEDERFGQGPPSKPELPPLKEFISSPIATVKSVAHARGGGDFAENVAKQDISHGANVQFVRAYDNIIEAKNEEERSLALQDLDELKHTRQDSFVRWTLDRHVRKVGRFQAHEVPRQERSKFMRDDGRGKKKTEWVNYGRHLLQYNVHYYGGHYIGAVSDLPKPTESALIESFERVLLTSTPVQDMFTELRRISHWEVPWQSATYMALYYILLIYSYITRAILLLILYKVLKRRWFPPSIEELREDLYRGENREATAKDISELIDQHGSHGWVDPLIEKAGPNVMLHIEDLANFMEMLRNFYEWRDPYRTGTTLGMLFSLWVLITLTPVPILVKASFFAIGILFFVLTPIAAHFPQYRLLASPLMWTFWRIPTHAEWAIARLQAEATERLRVMKRDDPKHMSKAQAEETTPESDEQAACPTATRIGRYHCISDSRHGNLCVTTDAVSFEMHLTADKKWRVRYNDLRSVQKIVGSSTISSGDDILFVAMDGREFRVSALRLRDEVFSQIVGYSNVQWQRTG